MASSLAAFQDSLGTIITGHPQRSEDPDETLKREYLLNAPGRLDDLLAKADEIGTSIDGNRRRIRHSACGSAPSTAASTKPTPI